MLKEDKVEEVPLKDDEEQRIELTINPKNPFQASFWEKDGKVMKVADDKVWQGFVSEEIVPKDRYCSFAVRIMTSQCNNTEIGLVGQGYKMERNKTCKESVVYHLADGMVLSGVANREGSEWKRRGQPVRQKARVLVEVKVDPERQTVTWVADGQTVGQGALSGYLKKHECVAYVMMCHKGDILELNP